ncbi:MAG: hypothetical protein IPH52_12875 [Leptospiraceae bacterium]|nr:hypothetical protein [Leptospiraceae bacterium]
MLQTILNRDRSETCLYVYKGTQKPKTAKIYLFFLLLLLFCKTTNSAFIQESNLEHHNLEIKLSDLQPRIKLLANHRKQPDLKSLSFILDTGSNISLIRKNIFLPESNGETKSFRLKSLSGEMEEESTEMKLNLFDEKRNLISENFIFQSFNFNSKFTFDGILGNDALAKFDLFIELPDSVFLIKPSFKKNLKEFKRIPFVLSEGHIILEVMIGKFPCKLLLDTGAGISYLNQKKAVELNLKIGGKASFMDLRGELQETIYHLGENLCVAENLCQKKIELLSGISIEDFLSTNGKLDGILGLNWIENYSILVDYQNLNLYIKQR